MPPIHVDRDGQLADALGILRHETALWEQSAAEAAVSHLADEDRTVLILKADRVSPVHRRVPLDVVMVRLPDGTLSVHAGLWTSEAMRTSAQHVPVLRKRLKKLDKELGFSPSGHAGKALAHVVSTLPHDLLISFDENEVRAAALTAMSLGDRPRPKLLLLPGALRRHLFAFVWLPRDELSTARRKAIGIMRFIVESRVMPALLTSTSTGPRSDSTWLTPFWQESKSDTSHL